MDVNKVYKSQLLRNYWHLGLPLRNGRPVQSGPHTQEVLIGDVGWQSRQDSSFHVLFNAIDPTFHPDLSPPETYEPFPISPSRTPAKWRMLHHVDAAVLPAGPIRSTSITRIDLQASASTPGSPVTAELHVTCSKDRGALLVLHHPADHAHLEPCREVKAYVLRHYQSWYDHAASLGLDLEMGEIVFVTAWYKTSKWDTFTFTSKSHDVQLSLQGTAPVAADLSLGMSVSSGTFSDVHQLYGPAASSAMSPRGRVFSSLYVTAPTAGGSAVYADSDAYISGDLLSGDRAMLAPNQRNLAGSSSEQEGSPALNQCLFIQGYIPYKRRLFPPYLKAAAGPHDLGGHAPDPASVSPIIAGSQSGSDSDPSVEYLVEPPRAYDPLVETLEYIMEKNPTVEAVVAHHQDLSDLFSSFDTSDDWPEDIQIWLEQLPKSTVTILTQNVLDHAGIIEAPAAAGVSPPSPRTGSSLLSYDARQPENDYAFTVARAPVHRGAMYEEIVSAMYGEAQSAAAYPLVDPSPLDADHGIPEVHVLPLHSAPVFLPLPFPDFRPPGVQPMQSLHPPYPSMGTSTGVDPVIGPEAIVPGFNVQQNTPASAPAPNTPAAQDDPQPQSSRDAPTSRSNSPALGSDDYDPNDPLVFQTLNADGTPKRPMNAFMIFARKRRTALGAQHPQLRTGEISKLLSKEWSTMNSADKAYYQNQARKLKDDFNSKYPDYVYRRRPNNNRKRRRSADRGEGYESSGSDERDDRSGSADIKHSDLSSERRSLASSQASNSTGFSSLFEARYTQFSATTSSVTSSPSKGKQQHNWSSSPAGDERERKRVLTPEQEQERIHWGDDASG